MDFRSPREISEELTREALIAISNLVPDTPFDAILLPEKLSSFDGIKVANGETTEYYRSELISISDEQSPDKKI